MGGMHYFVTFVNDYSRRFFMYLMKHKDVKTCKLDFYKHCVMGKQTRVKFGTAIHNTKGILDYIHSDVWEHSRTTSMGGMHYFITFVDDYSRIV